MSSMGLQVLKWYSFAIITATCSYIIMRSEHNKDFRRKYMPIVIALIPVIILILGGV